MTLRPCHHSFCNQCIRRHLNNTIRNGVKKKRDCPVCHAKIEIQKSGGVMKALDDEEAIVPNYGLQKAVDEYKQLRRKLYETLVELQSLKQQQQLNAANKPTFNPEEKNILSMTPLVDATKRTVDNFQNDELPSNKRPKRKCTVGNTVSYLEVDQQDDDVEVVENNHDVACKSKDPQKENEVHIVQTTVTTNSPATTTTREPATTVRLERKHFILVGKKKKDLVQMCKQEGIDWSGTDGELKDRIQRFADFWRAECDREEHKTREQVLDEFRKQEEIRKMEERRLNQSLEKKLVARLNQSRESVGVGNSAKVTSGNVIFDKKTTRGFRKLISILGKQRNYESFHDMVTKVCVRTNRTVPANLPNWKFDPDNDEDDGDIENDVVLVGSSLSNPSTVATTNPYHHRPNTSGSYTNSNRANVPSGTYTNHMNFAHQSVPIVNPYHHRNNLNNHTATWKPHPSPQQASPYSNPYNAKVQNRPMPPNYPHPIPGSQGMSTPSQSWQAANPYNHQRSNPTGTHSSPHQSSWNSSYPHLPMKSATGQVVSTPISTAGSSTTTTPTATNRIVTDTKPLVNSGGI